MEALIIDSDPVAAARVASRLRALGEPIVVATADEALCHARARHRILGLVVLDLELGSGDALLLCRRLTALLPYIPILVSCSHVDEVTLAEIHAAGAHDFIAKPAPAGELEFRARTAFRLSEERARRSKHEQRLVDWARQLEKTRRLLESTVCIDPLTGIANRRHFDALLRAEWRRAARDGTDLAVVFFDLDEFHAFNERYGHVGGDACLVRVARTLAHGLRRASDVLARYGGEELVAILPETDAVGAAVVAERLRARIEALQVPHAASPTGVVTLSAGVASHRPDGATTAEQLIAAADGALYRAKRDGRNRWRAEGIDEDRVIVRREPWPTPPVVILDPVLASRVPRFLAAVRGELSTSDDENAVARLRASATRIESTAIDLGLSQIGALASALGTAPVDAVPSHISELAWYVEHVQVVYRRAG